MPTPRSMPVHSGHVATCTTSRPHACPLFRASARGSYRPADACEDADEALTEQQRLEKAGGSGGSGDAAAAASFGLRALAAAPDGRVFAGFASGHLKCYSALGRFLFKKVRALVARSACIAVPVHVVSRTLAGVLSALYSPVSGSTLLSEQSCAML